MGASRHSKAYPSRKRKRRVVDLRTSRLRDETESFSDDTSFTGTTSAPSVFSPSVIPEEYNDDPVAPQRSAENTIRAPTLQQRLPERDEQRDTAPRSVPQEICHDPASQTVSLSKAVDRKADSPLKTGELTSTREFAHARTDSPHLPEKVEAESSSSSACLPLPNAMSPMDVAHNSSILEQAWIMKMAGEIARRIKDEKSASNDAGGFWDRHTREESPPPAYVQ
jgi:distribution and morphology protein 34